MSMSAHRVPSIQPPLDCNYVCISPRRSRVERLGPSQHTPHPPTGSRLAAQFCGLASPLEGRESEWRGGQRQCDRVTFMKETKVRTERTCVQLMGW